MDRRPVEQSILREVVAGLDQFRGHGFHIPAAHVHLGARANAFRIADGHAARFSGQQRHVVVAVPGGQDARPHVIHQRQLDGDQRLLAAILEVHGGFAFAASIALKRADAHTLFAQVAELAVARVVQALHVGIAGDDLVVFVQPQGYEHQSLGLHLRGDVEWRQIGDVVGRRVHGVFTLEQRAAVEREHFGRESQSRARHQGGVDHADAEIRQVELRMQRLGGLLHAVVRRMRVVVVACRSASDCSARPGASSTTGGRSSSSTCAPAGLRTRRDRFRSS